MILYTTKCGFGFVCPVVVLCCDVVWYRGSRKETNYAH